MESSDIYKQEYLLRDMNNLLKQDNVQDHPNEIKLQTEFEISDFSNLDCELSKIDLYLTNCRPTVLNNEETLLVFSEVFEAIGETYNKLETLWKFVHKNYFLNVDFVQIFETYLRILEVSELLINIVIQIITKTKTMIIGKDYLAYISRTDIIYTDPFWKLGIIFRYFENREESNILWEINIYDTINNVFINYETKMIPLSTIELVFKLLLNIITKDNIQYLYKSGQTIFDAAAYFKDDFNEAFLIILLVDENSASSVNI